MKDAEQSKRKPVQPTTPTPASEKQWSDGLKRMYDSVVEEPLPDSLKDLLARLDDKSA